MTVAALYSMAPFEMLQKAGFNESQTTAILNSSLNIVNAAGLATKHDLDTVRTGLDRKIDEVRTGLDHKIDEVRTDVHHQIDKLRLDMNHLGSRLTIRLGAIVVSTATLLPYLTNFLHSLRP